MLEKIKNYFKTKTWAESTISELDKIYEEEQSTTKTMLWFTFGMWITFVILNSINIIPFTELQWIMVLLLLILTVNQMNTGQMVDVERRFKKLEEKLQGNGDTLADKEEP